jgi:hypothetical protein
MGDFDARWKELASAARRAERIEAPLSDADAVRLLARARGARAHAPSRRTRTSEVVALAAAAALVLAAITWLAPDAPTLRRWRSATASELGSLAHRVPSAPRLPSSALVLELVPDVPGWLRNSFDVETAR